MFGLNHLTTAKQFPPKIHYRKYLTNATIHGKSILVKVQIKVFLQISNLQNDLNS